MSFGNICYNLEMELRELTKENIADVLLLEKNHAPEKPYYSKYDEEALNFIFDNPNTCNAIGLFDNNKLVGWGSYRTNWHRHSKENGVEISSIVINKNYRRKGLGKKILFEIIKNMKNRNVDNIYLTVSPLNIDALLLYLKNGFIIYNYKKDVYGPGSDRLYLYLKS